MEREAEDPSLVTSAERQRTLSREAEQQGDEWAALTHLAAACAFEGDPRDWLALGERTEGDAALRALAEALDALDHPDLPEEEIAETALRVAERANELDLRDVAEDALGEALQERPTDDLRRRFLRALHEALEGETEAAETYRAGRNDPCPCGSGRKFKRCHGSSAIPSAMPRSSEGALLLRLVTPYIDGNTEGATGMLDQVRRWVPREPAVNVLAGLIDHTKGERDAARRHFRLAAQGVERDIGVHRALLEAAIRIAPQDHDLAVEILEHAPPGPDPTAQGLAGALALALGYPREAVPLLERAVSSHEDPSERDRFRRTLARAWRERGDHAAALRTLDALGSPDADDKAEAALLSAWAGDASLERRCALLREEHLAEDARAAEAIAALLAGDHERAAAPLGEDVTFPAEHWRAEALDALGRDREAQAARRACAAGIALDSDELALQLDCALALDGPEAAKRRSEERAFLGLVPLRAIGRIALRLGDVREAEAAVRHLLEQSPRDVETLLLASEWQAGWGDPEAALRHLDDALAIQPRRHRLRSARADLLRQLHRSDEAQRALEDLVRESPASWRYRVALAELLDERGDVVRARDQWRAAHRAAPDVPAVARAIGRLEGEDRAFVRAREEAERSVRALLGDAIDALASDARAAAVGAEQDWRSLGAGDDHSTVVTQLAKAVEIELMRRLFTPFRAQGSELSDSREDIGGFGKWCRGQIASLSLGEMAFALGALAREERSPLLDAFHAHVSMASTALWDLGERLAMPLRTLAARRNAAVHKEPVSRAEAEDSRRTVLGREDREGLLALIVARFPVPGDLG